MKNISMPLNPPKKNDGFKDLEDEVAADMFLINVSGVSTAAPWKRNFYDCQEM